METLGTCCCSLIIFSLLSRESISSLSLLDACNTWRPLGHAAVPAPTSITLIYFPSSLGNDRNVICSFSVGRSDWEEMKTPLLVVSTSASLHSNFTGTCLLGKTRYLHPTRFPSTTIDTTLSSLTTIPSIFRPK